MEIDYSGLEKRYMIRNTKTGSYCGFNLQSGTPRSYKRYGNALNYIKKCAPSAVDKFEIDVFVLIHKGLPEECKRMYDEER